MSGGGGDTGGDFGGGDSGGAGKGGGGGGGGLGGSGSTDYTGTSSGGGTDPSGGAFSYAPGGSTGSLDSFVNDPSQGNLTGPGPATGSPATGGTDGTGGFAFDNTNFLSGLDQYAGSPVSAGGTNSVFDTGTSAVPNSPASGQSAFETATGSAGAAPAGASAASIAAPSGVSGNPDAASSTDLSSSNRKSVGNAGSGVNSGGSSGGILDSIGIGKGNMASSLVAGAGLLNNLVNGKQAPPQSAQLTNNASFANDTAKQQTSAGQALQQWQTTGTLPDSYESQVQRAAQDAKTRAVSNAAAQGLPTDPTQNTALAQQLNAIDAAIPNQREQIASQLAQSGQQMVNAGLQATGISSGVYQTLANLDNAQNQARGAAIANFAGALNGGNNKGLTLKVA